MFTAGGAPNPATPLIPDMHPNVSSVMNQFAVFLFFPPYSGFFPSYNMIEQTRLVLEVAPCR